MEKIKKMTQKQINKLFEGMAHDLYSKFEENVMAIYSNLFFPNNIGIIPERRQLIRNRLMVEFGYVRLAQEEKEVRNAAKKSKKDDKKKKNRASTKNLVSTKKT